MPNQNNRQGSREGSRVGNRVVRQRVDKRQSSPPKKITKFDPTNLSMEVESRDFQLLKAHNLSEGQQDRVLGGMNPGPVGEGLPSGHRTKEEGT